jgi:DNA-binding MarR family transcriptional regulator
MLSLLKKYTKTKNKLNKKIMNIKPELLALKKITPLSKLILGLILNESPVVMKMAGGYEKTCGEIGKLLGVSRARILKEFDELLGHDLITSKKGDGTRITNVTQRFLGLLDGSKSATN